MPKALDGYNAAFLAMGVLLAIGGLIAAIAVDPGRDAAQDAPAGAGRAG